MPAYVIAAVSDAWDQEKLAEYRERNTDVVAAHGGRFIARGGPHDVLEGEWNPKRLVIIEFPDMAAAHALARVGGLRTAHRAPPERVRHGRWWS